MSIKSAVSKVKRFVQSIGPRIQGDNYGTGTTVGGTTYVSTGPTQTTTGTSTPSSSGGGITVVSPAPKVTSYTGGGGGISYGPVQQVTTPSVQTQIAQDIGPISTVSPAVPVTGFKAATSYYQRQRQMDVPVFQAAKGAGQIAIGKVTGKQKKAYSGIEKAEEKATGFVSSVYPSGQAEKAYSEEVKSFNARTDNLGKEIESHNRIVAQYSEGAPEGVYERLKAKETELNTRIERQRETADVLGEKGKQLEVKGRYSFEKFSRGVVTGVVSAALFVPRVIVRPVKTITETGKGLMELPEQVVKQPAMTVGSILGSVATFYAGGKITSRIVKGKPIDPVKLDAALKTAEVKPIKTTGVVREAEIKTYKFAPEVEAELISRIRAGESVRITKSKIESPVEAHQKIISKSIPKTEIVSIEVINTAGNIISRRTLVGVEIKKGLTTYKDYTVGEGVGVYSPKSGVAVIDTLYMRGKPKQLPSKPAEFFKEREVIRAQKPIYQAVSAEEIMRLTKAKGVTFEGQIRRVATKEKQITYKDLTEVAEAEFKRFPSRKTKAAEIQRLERIDMNRIEIAKDLDPFIDIVGLEKTFKIKGAAQVTGKVAEPFEFTRAPSTRVVKPLDISKDLNLKALERPSANTQKLLNQLNKQSAELSVMDIPAIDMTAQIKRSVQAATKQITPTKTRVVPAAFDVKNIERELQKSYEESILNTKQIQVQLEKQEQKVKVSSAVVTIPKPRQFQFPSVTPAQISAQAVTQKQIERLMQTPKLTTPQLTTSIFQTPRVPVPKIDVPIVPFGFGSKRETPSQKQLRRLLTAKRKPSAAYTSSLLSAAFPTRAVPITKSQLKRLQTKVWAGTELRPMLRLTSDKEMEELIRKMKKKRGGSLGLNFNPFENNSTKGVKF